VKKLLFLLISAVILFATGCPDNAPKFDVKSDNYKQLLADQLKEHIFQKEWIEYKCLNDGYYHSGIFNTKANKSTGTPSLPTGFSSFNCRLSTGNTGFVASSQNAAKVRNEVLDRSLALINSAYDVYIRNIRKKRSVGEFLADLLQIGGSTAVGIVNGERAIQVIGVALTGFSAARKSADLNFYDDKTTSILIKRMDASRSVILGEIRQSQQKSTGNYSFDQALDDIVRYFDAGTLNRAFTELDKQTSLEAETARLGVLKIKKLEDVNKIVTVQQAQLIDDIDIKLTSLDDDLNLPLGTVENDKKYGDASAFLKAVYDKIKDNEDFKVPLNSLKTIAKSNTTNPELGEPRFGNLKRAFSKLEANQELSGNDYYSLINETVALIGDSPLAGKLLEIFNEVNKK
jgi:hypothetical protein